ncbi:MAG: GNAT family N-acetyltransferase [Telluria sp.]
MRTHIEQIWGWDDAWQANDFAYGLANADTDVIEVDGEFAGYCQIVHHVEADYLRMLIIEPRYRSAGVGARVLSAVTRTASTSGRSISLRVFRTNGAAQRFYEREGWSVTAREDAFCVMEPCVPTDRGE